MRMKLALAGLLAISIPAHAALNPTVVLTATAPLSNGNSRVVVADIDSGINPYHKFYRAGSPIYPAGSPPSAVTPAVLAEFGIDAAHIVNLTVTGNFAADFAADAAKWAAIQPGQLYWFSGTNIIAVSFDPTGVKVLPDDETDTHGVGTSSAVLTANPEAVLLFAETGENTGDAAAELFAFHHPAVDIVTTSYGYAVPVTGVGLPLPFTTESFGAVVEEGRLHFSSAANSPDPFTPEAGGAGPWWVVAVAGIEEGSSNGRTTLSGYFTDFVSDFTQNLPYCAACEDGYDPNVAGTSFATPRSAGVASRTLLEARRMMAHDGGIKTVAGKPILAAGAGKTISNWQLRRALEVAAYIDPVESYDPIEAVFDLGAIPNPVPASWLVSGWGNLSALAEKNVVPEALAQLGFGTPGRSKAPNFCDFQTLQHQRRWVYWNNIGYLFNTYAPPATDPLIACK
jgi:hypothetical protein